MRTDIKGSGISLTTALLDQTERRLRFALTRRSDRIVQVAVLVGDSNGPRGCENKFSPDTDPPEACTTGIDRRYRSRVVRRH